MDVVAPGGRRVVLWNSIQLDVDMEAAGGETARSSPPSQLLHIFSFSSSPSQLHLTSFSSSFHLLLISCCSPSHFRVISFSFISFSSTSPCPSLLISFSSLSHLFLISFSTPQLLLISYFVRSSLGPGRGLSAARWSGRAGRPSWAITTAVQLCSNCGAGTRCTA